MSTTIFGSFPLNHNLSFVHYNVQSIYTKLEVLQAELIEFDILAFSETWLNHSIDTEDLTLQSYQSPERKDRVGDSHGGVIIYVKEGIHYKRRNDLEIQGLEAIWIEVANNHKHILFGLFYRPPNSNANYYSSIEDSLSLAFDTNMSDIIVTGDFNFNLLNPRTSGKINSLCTQFSFFQTIEQPTHFTEHSSSIIDIILVSSKDNLILSGVGDPFLDQDIRYHCPIYGIFKFTKPKCKTFKRHIWNYEQGNYDLLRNKAMLVDWNSLQDDDVDIYSENIKSTILSIAKECIPNRHITIRPAEPPWITTEIKRDIRKRKRAYRKAKVSGLEADWQKFRKMRNKAVNTIRKGKKAFYDNLALKLKSESLSSKDWWSTLKKIISPQSKSSVPPLEHNNSIYTDDYDKANIINNYFQRQTLLDCQNAVLPDIQLDAIESQLSQIVLSPYEVEKVLETLPLGKASGPNGLSNRILRELSSELSSPLCSFFNHSLHTGCVPTTYKEANVTPVPKKGDLSIVSNYRPISLLNSEDKVFERLVFKHLYNHLHSHNSISSLQSGFMPGDSTVNQLAYLYNTFCQSLDAGKEVRVVFCDISKAFDRVWHSGLLLKLQAAGVTGEVLTWFKSYLSNRKQRVVLPGAVSNWTSIQAGVPQGSILGPLLFLLYINDIVYDIGSNIRLFADDTSLFIIVEDPITAAACLNNDIDKISQWAATWLVTFNPSKTESLLISRKTNKDRHPPIFMQNQKIIEVDSHKHVGIVLSNDCSWHQHIKYITDKAWNRINIMRKLKFKLDRKSLEIIYIAFIRPLLEYGDIIWDNCTQYEKNELDKIQNEAARIATGTTKLISIHALYSEIRWDTLQERRNNHKLTLFYKMTHNLTPLYLSSMVPEPISNVSRYNLRNSNNIRTVNTRTSQYYQSFLPSTIRSWNDLPAEVQQYNTLSSFRNHLNKDKAYVPQYFYTGSRKAQILHTRLRTHCSSLNLDLFMKNITDSPLCSCGSIEDAQHFFFHCHKYQAQRNVLLNSISLIQAPSLHLLLQGDLALALETNKMIFETVQKFILETKRF
ncbi:MAG: reverse transcriptase domain-containing protein [Candidatus Thiodiazotropha endolucinida]|nr:reverse transcriptase domain-containing protein [Candidatus Thiodiazotropha endolucinida]